MNVLLSAIFKFCTTNQLFKVEEEEFYGRLVYSNEATFYTNDKVNRHNISIWSEEILHVTIQHERDSTKVNKFCAISKNYVYGPFLFEGDVTGSVYLQMLQNWLMDELIVNDGDDFIYQQTVLHLTGNSLCWLILMTICWGNGSGVLVVKTM